MLHISILNITIKHQNLSYYIEKISQLDANYETSLKYKDAEI